MITPQNQPANINQHQTQTILQNFSITLPQNDHIFEICITPTTPTQNLINLANPSTNNMPPIPCPPKIIQTDQFQ